MTHRAADVAAGEVARERKADPRLLIVGSALGGGGSETRVRLLAEHMFSGKADVAVLIGNGADALGAEQTVHALGWAGPSSYPGVLRRLRRAITSKRYAAVLSFGLYPNTLAWASVCGLRRRPALIMTEITRPYSESRLASPPRRLLTHVVRRLTYPGADLCAANSEDGVSEIILHYGVDRGRIRRLPNLLEPDRLAELAAETYADAPDWSNGGSVVPSICVVSRLVSMKRIDTLLAAAGGLPSGLDWRIDIIGDGPERAALCALAERLGISNRVHIHGWQRNPYPAMGRATVTVLASTYEGFSNTVLESMALGTPVITSFCSSDARRMHDEGAALGFPVGDHLALRQHLQRVLTDAHLRAELDERGRRHARRHTLSQAVPEYEALVRDAVRLRRAQP